MLSAPKPRECAHCGKSFIPFQSMQKVCPTVKCAKGYAKKLRANGKRELRERKAALQTIPDLIKIAQREFNAWIRQRDRASGYGCISSGRPLDWSGNAVDAGHYRSTGAAPHLRFDERNCHAQSKHDNQYKAGNVVDYRINLIKRIGLEAVEALEADNAVHKWTADELRQIASTYRAKRKQLATFDSQPA